MVGPAVENHSGTVFLHLHFGIIGIVRDNPCIYGILCHLLCRSRINIRHADSHTQLQGIGKFIPLANVTVINIVKLTECFRTYRKIFLQHGTHFIKFLQHLLVNSFLRIIGHIKRNTTLLVYHLAIRNGAIHIRHTVHNSYPQQFGKSQCYRIIALILQIAVKRIRFGKNITIRLILPVNRRVISFKFIGTHERSPIIPGKRTCRQSLDKLIKMLFGRYHQPLQTSQGRAYIVVFASLLILGHFVLLAVDFIEVARTGCSAHQQKSQGEYL